ncbi:MAG TPA: VCBS repeat-containing protein, partial [Candidatus Sulfotelmatobacter sp.]|nr:VCBS repeat-containing protein [Candidatus Sulfotelmatobacter sp.]
MRAASFLWTIFFSFSVGVLLSAISLSQAAPNKPLSTTPPKTQPPTPAVPLPKFEDIAEKAGLTVAHISSPDKKYIVESMSGGVGLIDCDNDGKLDIITVNGSTVQRYRQGGDPMITLYHQDADLKFTDITKPAGLTRKGWGMGIAVADY